MVFMNEINFNIEETEKIDLSMDVGIKEVYPPIEDLKVTPSKEQQIFNHENSYGYDKGKRRCHRIRYGRPKDLYC